MTDLASCEATISALTRLADGLEASSATATQASTRAGRWADGFDGEAAAAHQEACRVLATDLADEAEALRGLARSLGALVDETRESDEMRSAGLLDEAREHADAADLAWVDALWRYGSALPIPTPAEHPLAPPAFVAPDRPPEVVPDRIPSPGPTEPDAPAPEVARPGAPEPTYDPPDAVTPRPAPPTPAPPAEPVQQIRTLPAPAVGVVEDWPAWLRDE